MSWDHYETTPLDRIHYDLAFTVPDSLSSDDEIGIRELPSMTCVNVHCGGPLSLIARAWDYLYEGKRSYSGERDIVSALIDFQGPHGSIPYSIWFIFREGRIAEMDTMYDPRSFLDTPP